MRLPFGVAPAGDMFQREIDEIFRECTTGFGIADDISVVGYDLNSIDDETPLQNMLQIYRKENL